MEEVLTMNGAPLAKPGNLNPTLDPRGGGQRRYELSEILVTNTQFGVYTANVATWRVNNPSGRLKVFIAFTFEPETSEDTTFPGGGAGAWIVVGDVWVKAAQNKARMMRGNRFLPATPLPTSVEMTTGAPQMRGTVTIPNLPGDGIVPGRLWITAAWEPGLGESYMPDEELAKLFQVCSIEVGAIAGSQTGGGG
jgi:hypothetical protein